MRWPTTHGMGRSRFLLVALACVGALPAVAGGLAVTAPAASNAVITRAGDDFATSILSDAWDMNSAGDVDLENSRQLAQVVFAGGHFVADSTGNDPAFYVLWPGFDSAVPMTKGALFPISTSRYRYFTMKIRETAASGPALTAAQPVVLYFLMDTQFAAGHYGRTNGFYVQPGEWQIVQFDMLNDVPTTITWTTSSLIHGLRVDPTINPNVKFEVDWVHLSAPAASAAEQFLVKWTDSGSGPYTVTAIDADDARLELGSGITGTQFLADFSRLPPGGYAVEVSRSGAVAQSPGHVQINDPPAIMPLQPDARGDTAHDFALQASGNPWGPMDAGDVALTSNLTDISYANPVGSLSARPTNSDPAVYFDSHGHPISTDEYRSLCFTLQVMAPPQATGWSVARLLWGDFPPHATSQDIVLHEGMNEYCFADMDAVPTEPNELTNQWNGSINTVRLDPLEFPVSSACTSQPSPDNCHDFRIDSLTLSPYDSADPNFIFRWHIDDMDSPSAMVKVYLDPDHAFNGNEILVAQTQSHIGDGSLTWVATDGVALGVYNVLFVSDDGINQVMHYAGGPLKVVSTVPDNIFANGFE